MPAEWEPHAATWIAWPHNRSDWPGKFEPIPWIYVEIVRNLAQVERTNILVNDDAAEAKARKMLVDSHVIPAKCERPGSPAGNVVFHRMKTNRGWTRDCGPIFIRRNARKRDGFPALAATTWRFNGWAKYNDWRLDAPVSAEIAKRLGVPAWQPAVTVNGGLRRIVLEGGSIDVNGRGTLITTEECLLSEVQQRNPGVTREQLEQVFADYLGVSKVIWLGRGIAGDDTHGHVDDITRFVGPRTVLTAYEPDRSDPNHEPLRDNFRRLQKSTDQSGKPLSVVTLPMPAPVVFSGPAAARQLRQFLYCEPTGAGARFRRSQRPGRAQHPGRALSRSQDGGHLLSRFHLGTGRAALHDPATTRGLGLPIRSAALRWDPGARP